MTTAGDSSFEDSMFEVISQLNNVQKVSFFQKQLDFLHSHILNDSYNSENGQAEFHRLYMQLRKLYLILPDQCKKEVWPRVNKLIEEYNSKFKHSEISEQQGSIAGNG